MRLNWLRNENLDAVLRDTSAIVNILFNPDGSFRADDDITSELRADFPDNQQLNNALAVAEEHIQNLNLIPAEIVAVAIEHLREEARFLDEQRESLASENPDDPEIQVFTSAIAVIEDEIGTMQSANSADVAIDHDLALELGYAATEAPWGVFFIQQLDLDALSTRAADEVLARRGVLPGMPENHELVDAVVAGNDRLAGIDGELVELLQEAVSGASGTLWFEGTTLNAVKLATNKARALGFEEQLGDAMAELEHTAGPDTELGDDELRTAYGRWALAVTEHVIEPALAE